MDYLEDKSRIAALRTELIAYLNASRIDGRAILAITRHARVIAVPPGEFIIRQDERDPHIYFMMDGETHVSLVEGGVTIDLGERSGKTMLGEIAFFNDTPPTATVKVIGDQPAILFQLTHEAFREVLERFPGIRATLVHIGDLRVISQYNGFIPYTMFMDLIGGRKDRFAVNRAFAADVDFAIGKTLLPLLDREASILDVGDGPGVLSEIITENEPERGNHLFIQATELEKAIFDPLEPRASDLSRAEKLAQTFDAIVALQVFNLAGPEELPHQFRLAAKLLADDGILFVIRSNLLDLRHPSGTGDSFLIFTALEELVAKVWPGPTAEKPLVETTFTDADLEPLMEWNRDFCEMAAEGKLAIPENVADEEEALLGFLLDQAKKHIFNPDELHFRWLVWKATEHGFKLEKSEKNLDIGFYYQMYRKS
ncbi:MAG: cyclic nucleotide-binding domain-containing protein [bacterium]